MKIRYKDNLTAGILSIIFGIVLYLLTPIQIKAEASSTYGITSRSIPYALSVLVMISESTWFSDSCFGRTTPARYFWPSSAYICIMQL